MNNQYVMSLLILAVASTLLVSDADSQVKTARAQVLDMHAIQPLMLDDGCLKSNEQLLPEGCEFDPARAIGIRGIITDTVRLQYLEMPKGTKSPDHNHPDEEVFYILTGKLKVSGGDDVFTIGPGDIFVVPAYVAA